ncbi:MAG: SIR2 family protein [Bacteroidota bacterium]|nr:SIR2 family protein [Bacteroidota bacterium]
MDKNFHASIKKIIEAKNQNKLVVFVGAGVSLNSGIPKWDTLIDILKDDLNIGDEKDFLKIPQLYYRQRGENEYITKVRSALKYKKAKFNEIHKLIFELKPLHVITTNYDDLLEQYVQQNSLPYQVISRDSDLPYVSSNNYIIKMHGDLGIGNIVLKENDYLNYSHNFPLIESYIRSLFATKLILFIGFSYSDWNIKFITQNVINKLRENIQPAYLLELNEDENALAVQKDYLKSFGINLLNYNKSIPQISCGLSHDGGKKLFRFLDYIVNFNSFKIETENLDFLQKLEKGFLRYSDMHVFLPSKIVGILESIGIRSSTDYQNSHCLIIYGIPEFKKFINDIQDQWSAASDTSEKIKVIEQYFNTTFSAGEKQTLIHIWEKTLTSGIYFLTYESISNNTKTLNLFNSTLFKPGEVDSYYTGEFVEVEKKINSYKETSNVDELICAAFLSYKTFNHLQAYSFLNKASSISWQNGKYLKYYICKYNIVKLKHAFRWGKESNKELFQIIYNDINKIDLNEIYYSLPKEDRDAVQFLIRDFIGLDFKYVDLETTKQSSGDAFSTASYSTFSNKVYQVWNFINYNHLFGEDFEEYKLFYKRAFRQFLKYHQSGKVLLRRSDFLIAIHHLDNQEISEIIETHKVFEFNINTYERDLLKTDFLNIIKCANSFITGNDLSKEPGYGVLLSNLINNYLQVLSHMRLEIDTADLIVHSLFTKIYTRTNYSKGIYFVSANIDGINTSLNVFIKNQKMFGSIFKESTLNQALDFLIDHSSIGNSNFIMYLGELLREINPSYKVPLSHYENRIVNNFSHENYIHILISLQPLLKKKYSENIKEIIINGLNKRFNLTLFQIGLENKYIKFSDYKGIFFKTVEEVISNPIFPTIQEELFFVETVINNKIDIKSKNIKSIMQKSDFLFFWLDLDNFDFKNFKPFWTLYYSETLYNHHAKFNNIKLVKENIKNAMTLYDNTSALGKVYFTFFDKK